MKKYLLTIEYDGTNYVGWQQQDNGVSIQEKIEAAIKNFCDQDVRLHAAGRTDSGVHALGQRAHFEAEKLKETPDKIRDGLNFYLKNTGICVLGVEAKTGRFHARFSAKERRYLYRILNRRSPPTLDQNRVWHVTQPLNLRAMRQAAKVLVGRHDFSSFRAANCQSESPVKSLKILEVHRVGEEIHIEAAAQSFLHHMVRNITGTLVDIGRGKYPAADMKAILKARDRKAAGPKAPPHGLYFVGVGY